MFLLTALFLYNQTSGNWLLFALLLFTPDISMVGYLKNKKLGTITYNLGHNYILAFAILIWGLINSNNFIVSLGLILMAHVGLDRFLGFGLKYQGDFKDTHIQKL